MKNFIIALICAVLGLATVEAEARDKPVRELSEKLKRFVALSQRPMVFTQTPRTFVAPIQGELNIQFFVDHDVRPGRVRDYKGGKRTYDLPQQRLGRHTGTDFRAPVGTPIVAAAAGTVVAVLDGATDGLFERVGWKGVHRAGQQAGNLVAIRSGNLVHIYAHTKRGSARVHVGQKVRAGEVIAEVGLSGVTNFPHVHFEVRAHGRVIDPYAVGLLTEAGR